MHGGVGIKVVHIARFPSSCPQICSPTHLHATTPPFHPKSQPHVQCRRKPSQAKFKSYTDQVAPARSPLCTIVASYTRKKPPSIETKHTKEGLRSTASLFVVVVVVQRSRFFIVFSQFEVSLVALVVVGKKSQGTLRGYVIKGAVAWVPAQ